MIQLPLHDWHASQGAKMGEFAGYAMPLYYSKPLDEHHQVRRQAGVFDISHMGQFTATGSRAEAFLQHALTNDVTAMRDGKACILPFAGRTAGCWTI